MNALDVVASNVCEAVRGAPSPAQPRAWAAAAAAPGTAVQRSTALA
jgi:hypothetical protein